MEQTTFSIEGMTCGHCVAAVRNALAGLDGVEVREVAIGSAAVAYDPAAVSPERIAEVIGEEGYAAKVAGS